MKYIISIITIVLVFAAFVGWKELNNPSINFIGLGTFVVLSLTLVVLIIYAHDTRLMAKVAKEQWERSSVLNATYSMEAVGEPGGPGRTMFRIHNPSTLVVRAKVRCNFLLYGQPVDYHNDFNGTNTWYVFPQQSSQGWFEIATLLETSGKTCETMIAEATTGNRSQQLTMDLSIEFRDELGDKRSLPDRKHFFDFKGWRWIPHLTKQDEWI